MRIPNHTNNNNRLQFDSISGLRGVRGAGGALRAHRRDAREALAHRLELRVQHQGGYLIVG